MAEETKKAEKERKVEQPKLPGMPKDSKLSKLGEAYLRIQKAVKEKKHEAETVGVDIIEELKKIKKTSMILESEHGERFLFSVEYGVVKLKVKSMAE